MQLSALNPRGQAPAHVLVARFAEAHPWIVDGAAALVLAFLTWSFAIAGVAVESGVESSTAPEVAQLAVTVGICLPIAVRRVWPVAAASVCAALSLLSVILLVAPSVHGLAAPIMVYSVSAYRSQLWGRVFLGVGLFGALITGIYDALVSYGSFSLDGALFGGATFAFAAVCVTLAWLLGDVKHRRRREIDALAEHNRLLLQQREQEARLAADAERMRIAREMHDIVAHSTSVMIAQADGGRFVLAAGEQERAEQAFATIAETGRDSLDQMRRMLGVLRSEESRAATTPLPDIGDLPELIADVRAAGLPVSLLGSVHAIPELPEGAGLAVYRIVQEALTNTLKHAGPGAQATVRLRTLTSPPRLLVTIDDTGQPAEAMAEPQAAADSRAGTGSGLVGMRERAAMLAGTFSATQDAEGFHVAVEIPLAGTMVPGTPPPPLTGQQPADPPADQAADEARVRQNSPAPADIPTPAGTSVAAEGSVTAGARECPSQRHHGNERHHGQTNHIRNKEHG